MSLSQGKVFHVKQELKPRKPVPAVKDAVAALELRVLDLEAQVKALHDLLLEASEGAS